MDFACSTYTRYVCKCVCVFREGVIKGRRQPGLLNPDFVVGHRRGGVKGIEAWRDVGRVCPGCLADI